MLNLELASQSQNKDTVDCSIAHNIMQVLQVVTIMVLSIYLHDIIDRHTIASVFHTVSAIWFKYDRSSY